MAQRRMFSKSVTNSSDFLMMSQSAQNLYFHFGMNADDDGFCEVFTVMRMTDSKPDDLRALHEKGFIFVVDTKICIVKDWHENNQIRLDRYKASKYFDDPNIKQIYASIMEEKIKEIDIYKDLLATGLPNGNQMAPQDRVGKGRVGKDNKIATEPVAPAVYNFQEQIKLLEDNPRRDLNIVAFYLAERKPNLQTQDQFNLAIRRHLRGAKALQVFTNEQIIAGAKKAKREYGDKGIDWTLETLTKILTK